MKLSFKRLIAFLIDCIMLGMFLFFIQWLIISIFSNSPLEVLDDWPFELWIFSTVSLPAWLYFIFMEKIKGQTLGKMIMKLVVRNEYYNTITYGKVIGRTFIRFIPWELLHLFFFAPYSWWGINNPKKGDLLFLVVAFLILFYIIFMFINKGEKAFHDYLFKTRVD